MFDFEAMVAREAHEAGMRAGQARTPSPIMVGSAVGLSSEIDPSKPTYYVPEGVCGFAWVTIKPATTRFAKWMKSVGRARPAYGGGLQVWVSEFGQSMERKRLMPGPTLRF